MASYLAAGKIIQCRASLWSQPVILQGCSSNSIVNDNDNDNDKQKLLSFRLKHFSIEVQLKLNEI